MLSVSVYLLNSFIMLNDTIFAVTRILMICCLLIFLLFGLKLKTVEEVKAQRREELNKEGYSGGPLQVSSPTSTFAHLFEDNEPDNQISTYSKSMEHSHNN